MKGRTALVVVVLSLFRGVLLAQTVREKVGVEVITVRLTARGPWPAGRRIEDLKVSDLVLMVDGKPVPIETFSGPEREPAVSGAPVETLAQPAASASPLEEPPPRTMIFVDEVDTHPFDRKDTCAELVRYLRAPGIARQDFSVVGYDGAVHMETGWTQDAEAAARALSAIGSNSQLERVPGSGTLSTQPQPSDFSNAFSSNIWISIHRERFSVALMEALAAFPQTPGRKRLLVLNGGNAMLRPGNLGYIPGPSLVDEAAIRGRSKLPAPAMVDGERAHESQGFAFDLWSRAVSPGRDVLSMNDVVAKALEEDVEIIPVYARAIDRDFDVTVAAAMIGLARDTGAEAIGLGRDASRRMLQMETRAAYELTFREPAPDHAYHRIALKCRRPFVRLEYRRGFRIPLEEELTLDTVVAGLRDPDRLTNPMQVQASQQPAADATQRPATRLAITYAPPLETGASDERPVSLVAVGEARNGDRTEPVAWSGTAERHEGDGAFETSIRVNVSPEYAWSVAVRDQPTGLTSYVFVPAPATP
ncbi:MAG TPA: hypothetical protein VKG23_17585 [Thermoanaerobaculia bacterium]|nr:hypothetical protein [Thermoanaerobaculia bacterium]